MTTGVCFVILSQIIFAMYDLNAAVVVINVFILNCFRFKLKEKFEKSN